MPDNYVLHNAEVLAEIHGLIKRRSSMRWWGPSHCLVLLMQPIGLTGASSTREMNDSLRNGSTGKFGCPNTFCSGSTIEVFF